tara:strand:- start:1 stop:762 length:762 start_codon:yes stop_codon:yes gene_type:complete
MIDSHCHLDHEPLYDNINNVIKRSKEIGIDKLLTISTSFKSYKNVLNIIKIDPIIYGSVGIHPHESDNNEISSNFLTEECKKNDKIIGIGETGLDYFYENSKKIEQIESFNIHTEAASNLNYPLIIHSREAEEDTLNILNNYRNSNLKPLMHCFTGSKSFAKKLVDIGSYFSASGIITFKNSTDLQDTFKYIPNDRILIETDSPFLAPVPMRGKKNEPSFLKYTLEKISFLKKIDYQKMDDITSENFNNLFFR